MRGSTRDPRPAGDISLRIVSSEPATANMLRLDQLVAAIARRRLWLTDAYYSGISTYVQALRAAAADGVDVRLLVPHASDIPILKPLSRAGYRTLLEAGIRVFEWNGTMLHAKTAVADSRWARVGSTNLNVASWLGNCELDAVIEDTGFAARMEALYLRDLSNSTEVVLDDRHKVRAPAQPRRPHGQRALGSSGSAGTVTAGAVRIGSAVSAVLATRRVLGPVQTRLTTLVGALLCGLSVGIAIFPRVLAFPIAAIGLWGGLALLWRGLHVRGTPTHVHPTPSAGSSGTAGQTWYRLQTMQESSEIASTSATVDPRAIERWESEGGRALPSEDDPADRRSPEAANTMRASERGMRPTS
jgi:cardiolipin synthase